MGARTQETGCNDSRVPRGDRHGSGAVLETGCVLKTRKPEESAALDPWGGFAAKARGVEFGRKRRLTRQHIERARKLIGQKERLATRPRC